MTDAVDNAPKAGESTNPDLKWYVVHAYSGMEKAVERNIIERIQRGHIVEAHVVLSAGHLGDAEMVKLLQDHVKAVIAPYKYPRRVVFVAGLPKTQTGKIQRFRLKG